LELRPPPLYRVVLLNDDVTPMSFVVALLIVVFGHDQPVAERLMWQAHTKGAAVVGIYPREIAEMKVELAHGASRAKGYPLRCIMEPETEPSDHDGAG